MPSVVLIQGSRGPRRGVAALLALTLASSLLLLQAGSVAAATPCSVWSWATWTNGTTAYGRGSIDCPSSPQSDWVRNQLKENYGPFTFIRDDKTNGTNSSNRVDANTSYYCNGHGTDDWWGNTQGQDLAGGNSGWIAGVITSLTC